MTNTEINRSTSAPARPLNEVLFGDDPSSRLFAVVDGAKIAGLLGVLAELEPPAACLFAGKLDPSVEKVAPYVVEIERGGAFGDWLLARYWGKDAGVFLRSELELGEVRKHLKQFTMARLPDGEQAFFRFYDPRVLRVYLPTCTGEEVGEFLGGVVGCFLVESEGGGEVLEFAREGGGEGVVRVVGGG